jgi:4'-phosphopantetheinyl transferase
MIRWPSPPTHWPLAVNEVHLWCAQLQASPAQLERFTRLLSPDEQTRANRFRLDRHRSRFIISRALLRHFLARYLDSPPECISFNYGPFGKPFLTPWSHPNPIHFNIAHSEDLALFAFSPGPELGVDIESIRPISQAREIADRFFSPSEAAALQALPEPERQSAFFRCWTQKEAVLKALGNGISAGLNHFEVPLSPAHPDRPFHFCPKLLSDSDWLIFPLAPAPRYLGALALPAQPIQIKCWHWTDPGADGVIS